MAREVMLYSYGETLGDGLVKLPAVAAARAAFMGDRLIWCAPNGSVFGSSLKPLASPLIDEVLVAPGGLKPLDVIGPRPFGGRRFDVVIDTQLALTSALTARRAARGVFVSAAAGFMISDRRPKAPWPAALVDQLTALIGLAANRSDLAPRPVPVADPAVRAVAATLLPPGPRYVGLAPGAGVKAKCWPLEQYLALSWRLRERGLAVAFLLGPDEAEWVARVRAEAPFALLPEQDRVDGRLEVKGPLLAAALAGRLAAAVANDSGVGHTLALGGAPLVSLQVDARKAAKFRPAAPKLELLIAETFPGDGMAAIPLAAVEAALERVLA